MGGVLNASFVVLRLKCIFEIGLKLWTQYDDNFIVNFIVGWILDMSEKRVFIHRKIYNLQKCFDLE